MRILVVHSFYRASLPSGENDAVLAQVDLLRTSGHIVEVVGPTSPESLSPLNEAKLGWQVATGRGTDPRHQLDAFRPDMVHVHNLFPNVATRWLDECSIPVAMTLHNYRTLCVNGVLARNSRPCTECLDGSRISSVLHGCYHESRSASVPAYLFQRHLRRAIAESVDLLVFPSVFSESVIAPHLMTGRSTILPNYVQDIGIKGPSAGTFRSPYFLVLGRLTPEKGIDRLLKMWPTGLRLVIAGDGPERRKLELLAGGLDVSFTGFVGQEQRDPLLRGAAGLILPSITLEADPVVVAQALSTGTPCVANAGTATASLSARSPAIRAYASQEELLTSLEVLAGDDVRREARKMYEETWSAAAWITGYRTQVVDELVK